VLVGPSGCGKSTLIRLIIGVVHKDTGEVYFDGELVSEDNLMRIRRKIGYVIQDGGLFPHLTAGQNVSLLSEYMGWAEKRIEERLHQLAELTHFPVFQRSVTNIVIHTPNISLRKSVPISQTRPTVSPVHKFIAKTKL